MVDGGPRRRWWRRGAGLRAVISGERVRGDEEQGADDVAMDVAAAPVPEQPDAWPAGSDMTPAHAARVDGHGGRHAAHVRAPAEPGNGRTVVMPRASAGTMPGRVAEAIAGFGRRLRDSFLGEVRAEEAARRRGTGRRAAHRRPIETPEQLCRYALDVLDSYDREFLKRTGDWEDGAFDDYPGEWVHQLAMSYEGYRELDLQASRAALVYGAEGRYGDEGATGDRRGMFASLMRLAYVTDANVSAGVWLRLNDQWNDTWADPEENREQVARDIARVGIEARVNGLAKRYARGEYSHPFDSILGEAQRGSWSVSRSHVSELQDPERLSGVLSRQLSRLTRTDLEDRFGFHARSGAPGMLADVDRRAFDAVFEKLDESSRDGDWNRFSDQTLMLRRILGATDDDDGSPMDLKDDLSCLAYAAAVAGGSVSPTKRDLKRLADWQRRETDYERNVGIVMDSQRDEPGFRGDALMDVEADMLESEIGGVDEAGIGLRPYHAIRFLSDEDCRRMTTAARHAAGR